MAFAFAIGLFGFYYQIHTIFIEKHNEGILAKTALGFLTAAILGFFLYYLTRFIAHTRLSEYLKRLLSLCGYVLLIGLLFYSAYILYGNSKNLFGLTILGEIIIGYFVFLGICVLLLFVIKPVCRYSFIKASVIVFLGSSLYISLKFGMLPAVIIALLYLLYLISFGRFIVAGIDKLCGYQIKPGHETAALSLTFGVLGNYLLWYCLGRLSLLYTFIAICCVCLVLAGGFFFYRRALGRLLVTSFRQWSLPIDVDPLTVILLNISLYGLLLVLTVICIRIPGHFDSSAVMYCSSIYKFAKLHQIVFLPFSLHWPLIFQPLLFEVTGLPIFLIGEISALRLFNVLIFFSFFPFLMLLRHAYVLSRRVVSLLVFLYMSSSFSFSMMYSDKPEVIAFPAFLSLLVICLLMLKEVKAWYILAVGGLLGIIYNTKLVLIFSSLFPVLLLCIFLFARRPESSTAGNKKAVLISVVIFLVVCSIHFAQNSALRGNPFHPFASNFFIASHSYPEETRYTSTPKRYYKQTIPIQTPSRISGINLDDAQGMYRPLLMPKLPSRNISYWYFRHSINIVVILISIALPILLLFNSDRLILFCSLTAAFSFFLWFGWIGDALRYSTYFPSIVLLSALLLGKKTLPNIYVDKCWRYLIYIILILSVPLGIMPTFEKKAPREILTSIYTAGIPSNHLNPPLHPVADYLNKQKEKKPVLLVSDMKISQFGFFQPNFLFQPWLSSESISIVYITKIKPTHLLTAKFLDESALTGKYPFLSEFLELEKIFIADDDILKLYRFDPYTPWDRYYSDFAEKQKFSRNLLSDLESFSDSYRKSSQKFNDTVSDKVGTSELESKDGLVKMTPAGPTHIKNLDSEDIPQAYFVGRQRLPKFYVDQMTNSSLILTGAQARLFRNQENQPMIPVTVYDDQKLLLSGMGPYQDKKFLGLPLVYFNQNWHPGKVEMHAINPNPEFIPAADGLTIPGWSLRSSVKSPGKLIHISGEKKATDTFTKIQVLSDQRLALIPKFNKRGLKNKPVTFIFESRSRNSVKLVMSHSSPENSFISRREGDKWQSITLIGWTSAELDPYFSIEFGKLKKGDYIELRYGIILTGCYPLRQLKACGIQIPGSLLHSAYPQTH